MSLTLKQKKKTNKATECVKGKKTFEIKSVMENAIYWLSRKIYLITRYAAVRRQHMYMTHSHNTGNSEKKKCFWLI